MATKRKITRTEQPAAGGGTADDLVGQLVGGNYKLVRVIGTGGNAIVFEGRRQKPGLKVAVKVLAPGGADGTVGERFRQEARIARTLKGVNQVAFLDEGEVAPGQPYWVMEFLEGEDLATRLERVGHLEIPVAMTLAEGIGAALSEAHDLGIVHRDIKPANIFLARGPAGSEAVKVLDFGAAHVQRADAHLTQTGKVVGTPWYMSPEQARGQPLDARSDQFSLGILLFQILTGQVPFNAEQPTDVLFKITGDPHPTLESINPALPEEVEPVFDRVLAKRADDRFATVSQFVDALRLALGSKPRRKQTVVVKPKTVEAMPRAEAPPIELERALLNLAVLEAEPIAKAKQLAEEKHIELADAVLQLGLLDEEPLLKAATGPGRRYHLQARVRNASPAKEAVAKLTAEAARRLRVVPIGWSDILSEIRLYSAAPAVPDLEAQLKAATGAQSVSILLALPEAVRALSATVYGEAPPPSAEPAPVAESPTAEATPAVVEVAPPPSPAPTPITESKLAVAPREELAPAPVEPAPPAPPAEPPAPVPPASEYVPGPTASPANARLESDFARRAVRRAALAVGARHVALSFDGGAHTDFTNGDPLPSTVETALQAWVPNTPWTIDGWTVRSAPVTSRGRGATNVLFAFDDRRDPLRLDQPELLHGVAGQLALVLDSTQVLQRRSYEVDSWLDGDRAPGLSEAASFEGAVVASIGVQAPVLFLDLRRIVEGEGTPHVRLERLRVALHRAEAAVFAFGGASLLGSDTVIGIWGSREPGGSDVRRAVQCARVLGATVGGAPISRVGLAFGDVLIGADPRRGPGPSIVTGSGVGTATRLAGLGPGPVVTHSEILQRLGGQLELRVEPIAGVEGVVTLLP